MKYELLIVWESGEDERYWYRTREEAEQIAKGYQMAFGRQVEFAYIIEHKDR